MRTKTTLVIFVGIGIAATAALCIYALSNSTAQASNTIETPAIDEMYPPSEHPVWKECDFTKPIDPTLQEWCQTHG